MFKFFDLFRKNDFDPRITPESKIFQKKYTAFKSLLTSNNRALELIADLETIVYQDIPFTFRHALSQIESLIYEINSIVEDLNALSGIKFPELFNSAQNIGSRILSELLEKRDFEETDPVLPIEKLSRDNTGDVGGKAANLGEVYNRVNLPVPPGFAITAHACEQLLEYNELSEKIKLQLKDLNVSDTEKLMTISQKIRSDILKAQLPVDLEESIVLAARELKAKLGSDISFAVRSSATTEDAESTFAGQHATILNVDETNLIQAYKEVVSSMFNPRAIFYRRSKGYRDQDVVMSVACIMMIDAKVSGVLYTVDPNDQRHSVIMISAVWGLAALAVEGAVCTDFYQVDKTTEKVEIAKVATKEAQLRCNGMDGLVEECIDEALKNRHCLDSDQIKLLVDYAKRLEEHYGYALDIEWAIDRQNKLYILQARPLGRSQKADTSAPSIESETEKSTANVNHPVKLHGGTTASEGSASGFAYVIESDHALHHIPEGAIVISRQTSPRYVPLMGRVRAFITDVGSVTGHMASVAREFQIPTLVGTESATQTISQGEEITVDATHRIVYQGRVEEILTEKKPLNPMKNSPIYNTMKSALKKIAPLNLTDTRKENFNPDGCRTLHDIIRFAHEMSMQEMFRLSDDVKPEKSIAVPLRAYLPMQIYVIDLGNGLGRPSDGRYALIEDVRSIPFRALLKGMKNEEVDWSRDVGVDFKGLASMMAESVFRDPMKEGRMGAPSYAVVAGHYLNFNSRLGYHFTTIDTFCGDIVNDNYITFYFKGGAADIGRRSRRALLITRILKKLGFRVDLKGDMVRGEIKKYQSRFLEDRLDMLGRLLGSVRLLDMVIADDRQLAWYEEQFIKGNYQFKSSQDL